MNEPDFPRRAQTNIQLYGQLLAAGFAGEEVARVRDAYMVATELFAGQLRPEGRPFVCHVVGVASLLAMVRAPLATIIAGLLHSAYSHGDFGRGRGDVTPASRHWLRAAVGAEVERLLACYSRQPWNGVAVTALRTDASTLDRDVREVVVIRLADSVEDALDHGLRLSQKAANSSRDIAREQLVDLANALGYPALGATLDRLLGAAECGADLTALRDPHAGSYIVGPRSWREKVLPRLARFSRRGRAED